LRATAGDRISRGLAGADTSPLAAMRANSEYTSIGCAQPQAASKRVSPAIFTFAIVLPEPGPAALLLSRMTRRAGLLTAIAVALAASAPAQDIGFYKSRIPGTGGKESKVDLVFQGDAKAIAVSQCGNSIALVPYAAIEKLGSAIPSTTG
jgi:hypothetical protein